MAAVQSGTSGEFSLLICFQKFSHTQGTDWLSRLLKKMGELKESGLLDPLDSYLFSVCHWKLFLQWISSQKKVYSPQLLQAVLYLSF